MKKRRIVKLDLSNTRGFAASLQPKPSRKKAAKPHVYETSSDRAAKSRPFSIGKFIASAKGFGFIAPIDGGHDIFVPPHQTGGAMHGDTVRYKIVKEKTGSDIGAHNSASLGKPSSIGQVVEILQRPLMVGTFHISGATRFIKPMETKVQQTFEVKNKDAAHFGLADGHVVAFEICTKTGLCKINRLLGHINDPGVDVLALVQQAGVPVDFSADVEAEITQLPHHLTEAELIGRLDLRDRLIFTIDGDDTKDIDDAISFELLDDGNIELGVHIADVTHYVKEGSAIDISALERGTSIYLADRVIPMLPHALSSGICSLFADVDRLALSCIMTVNPQGDVVRHQIANSVIQSKMRWTYNNVQNILDDTRTSVENQGPFEASPHEGLTVACKQDLHLCEIPTAKWDEIFTQMDALRHTLRKKRESKGSLDFNLPEAKIRVGEDGRPISIEPHVRTNATGMIEEFMILCNETIAAHFFERESPFVYRTHEAPSAEKKERLGALTKNLGIKMPKSLQSPMALQTMLAAAEKTAAAQVVATAVLHSLPQARYTPDNPTHYGLASDAYCHFTSPIRRYADLQIHRIIKEWLKQQNLNRFCALLPEVCLQCSTTERIAETLEREVEQLKKVQFMSGHEGRTFEVVVSGVTQWGIYVTLPNTIEGLIPVENLQRNKYVFDKDKGAYFLKAGKKNKPIKGKQRAVSQLTHGLMLQVRLVAAKEDERKLIFALQRFN